VVFPPAIGDPVRSDAAAVTATRAHRCERESPRDGHRGGAVCRRAVAELAEEAAPPAVGDAVRGKGAGVTVPGADDLERQAAGELTGGAHPQERDAAGHGHRSRGVGFQTDAELTALVFAPAVRGVAGREAAAVGRAGAQGAEADTWGSGDGHRRRADASGGTV